MIFIYLVILMVTLFVIQYTKKIFYFKKRGLPSALPLPFLGLPIESFTTPIVKLNLKLRKKFGDRYGFFFGSKPVIVVSNPKICSLITKKEAHNFTDARIIRPNTKYIGDSFLFKKGKEWKDGRSLVSPIFTTKRIKEIFPHIQKATIPFLTNIETMIEEGKQDQIDVKDLLKGYSLDVIAKFVFALELNSAKDKNHPFVTTVRKLVSNNRTNYRIALLTLLPKIIYNYVNIDLMEREVLEYFAEIIRHLMKDRKESKQKFNDFLDMLMDAIEEKDLKVKEEEIIGVCLIFFFAGMETVSTTISNLLYCLVLNPDQQQKLYEELKALYPNKEINYDDLNKSKLLDANLKESQRMLPAANFIFRIPEAPIKILDLDIQANDVIAIDVVSLHNSPDFWTEPEKYKPERFLEKEYNFDNVIDTDNELFLPFGSGPRSCVATRFALVQVKYTLAQLLLNYEVYQSKHTEVPIKHANNMVVLTYKDMILGLRKRSK